MRRGEGGAGGEADAESEEGGATAEGAEETREDEEEESIGLPVPLSPVGHTPFAVAEEEGPLKKRGAVMRRTDEHRIGSEGCDSRVNTAQQ